jgi:hypothetical protein
VIRTSRSVEVVTFASSIRPDLSTEDEALAVAIDWADQHPVAYRIVTGTRSAVFRRGSAEYPGYYRDGDRANCVLRRLQHLMDRTGETGIFGWRARFTLEHYADPGFRGALFQLWDGQYARSAIVLDYTPALLETVLDQFTQWCDPFYEKVEVRIGKRVVHRFAAAPPIVEEEVDPLS